MPDEPSTKPLLDKLGVKPGSRVSLLGVRDRWFVELLRERGADVSTRRRKGSDLLFVAVEDRADLSKLAEVEPWMARNGAAWIVFPRGRKDLRDVDLIEAGVAAGLIDNKVARFSDTHTSMRFVIPLARR
jgi:hypothetical protein